MVFRIDEFKDICSIILSAVDSSFGSVINETLELNVEDNSFVMSVTNREYYVKVKLNTNIEDKNFHATVNANLFLRLIAKITTDTVELKIKDNNLIIIGNGTYKLPMIYEEGNILILPEIKVDNPTINFNIDGNILFNINKYNTKQFSTGVISNPIQKLYYVDERGAVTFTSGACVTKFTLSSPIKLLLNSKLVKLFNLFKGKNVNFYLENVTLNNNISQTRVKFETDVITITAILANSDISLFPVSSIRNRAFKTYSHSVIINRNELLQTIDRLMLFPNSYNKLYSKFIFDKDFVTIYDSKKENNEKIYYENSSELSNQYETVLDLVDMKVILDNLADPYITFNFDNNQAIVIEANDIYFVIPEIVE